MALLSLALLPIFARLASGEAVEIRNKEDKIAITIEFIQFVPEIITDVIPAAEIL